MSQIDGPSEPRRQARPDPEETPRQEKQAVDSVRPEASIPDQPENPRPVSARTAAPSRPKTSTSWQVFSSIISAAFIVATLFSFWMPGGFAAGGLEEKMLQAIALQDQEALDPALEPVNLADFPSNKIGIVIGHRGNDTGAVCTNGLTELEVNSNIAAYVQQKLTKAGYDVELLDEFDARLQNYQAGLLLSIHADSCDYINDSASGFKVASALSESKKDNAERLVSCIADRYGKTTGLKYHYQSITTDMTYYHAFDEIDPNTTAAIIEVGFLNLDQDILTTKPELLADGIVSGLQCYLKNEGVQTEPEATP